MLERLCSQPLFFGPDADLDLEPDLVFRCYSITVLDTTAGSACGLMF